MEDLLNNDPVDNTTQDSGDGESNLPDIPLADPDKNDLDLVGEGEENAKSEEGKGTEQDSEEGDSKGVVPEEYEDFTAPEGVSLDAEVLGSFKALAKETSLTQEHAQKYVDLAVNLVQKIQEQAVTEWKDKRQQWVDSLKSDPKYGGSKLNETIARAQRALKKFGSQDLISDLLSTGFKDNAGFIKMLANIDEAISEDFSLTSNSTTPKIKSTEEVFYGSNS